MNGEKNLEVAVLLDFYSELLTEKQRDVIDLYYNEDLSLAEIAEHENITRQGVRDSIKRGEQVLFEMEAALHLAEKSRRLESIAQKLEENAGNAAPEDIRAAAAEIRNIL
ncbi:putative DNA-binding protein [Huintestinicola sp.]|uniref:putative DNA-binding protein n=1 Tax=Huintestinicola sp. TaxID=2981661 RepID=UPI003D7CAEEB